MDAVYVVRPGDRNEELRYSIRSIVANLPFDELVVAGHVPKWLAPDVPLEVEQRPGAKQSNARANLEAAIESSDVSDPFLYLNDDMFVMAPVAIMPVYFRGTVDDMLAEYAKLRTSGYMVALRKTRDLLVELGLPQRCYELHLPFPVDKDGLRRALELGAGIPGVHWRTLYGNLVDIGGESRPDCKIYGLERGYETWDFLSTDDRRFARYPVGEYIRAAFPEPTPYENALTYDNVIRNTRRGESHRSPIPRHRSHRFGDPRDRFVHGLSRPKRTAASRAGDNAATVDVAVDP